MYNVDGFLFEDEATAQIARKEEEGIRFIKERTALNNHEVVLKLYKKLLEQELFVTPVGIRFMTELQNVLLTSNYIPRDEIPGIPVKATSSVQGAEKVMTEDKNTTVEKVVVKTEKVETDRYKKRFYVATFFAIIFAVSVMGMFLIMEISGNNTTIINYKDKILNEYSSWEAELKTEEERLEKWEALLEERENALREEMNGGE